MGIRLWGGCPSTYRLSLSCRIARLRAGESFTYESRNDERTQVVFLPNTPPPPFPLLGTVRFDSGISARGFSLLLFLCLLLLLWSNLWVFLRRDAVGYTAFRASLRGSSSSTLLTRSTRQARRVTWLERRRREFEYWEKLDVTNDSIEMRALVRRIRCFDMLEIYKNITAQVVRAHSHTRLHGLEALLASVFF